MTTSIQRRAEAIKMCGGKCTCCGEAEMLFLNVYPAKLLAAVSYARLKRNNAINCRVLCHNCVHGERVYGACPHQSAT